MRSLYSITPKQIAVPVQSPLQGSPVPQPNFQQVSQLVQQFSRVGHMLGQQDQALLNTPASTLIPAQPLRFFPPKGVQAEPAQQVKQSGPVLRPPQQIQVQTPASSQTPNQIQGQVRGVAKGTGYYPHNSRMEGGYKDMLGKPLYTLQDFLNGKSDYVAIALDKNMYDHYIKAMRRKYQSTGQSKYRKYLNMQPQVKYGDTFRIPELEQKYGRKIIFKAVDTGGAFTDKNFSRVDICTGSQRDSVDATINGRLTLIQLDG